MAEEDTEVFHYNDPVIKAGEDRHFEGVVVVAFRERLSGKWGYVVEDDRGVFVHESVSTYFAFSCR
jgi:hypothetical protein